jgi:hypothetical protein
MLARWLGCVSVAVVVSACQTPAPPTPTSPPQSGPIVAPPASAGRVDVLTAANDLFRSGNLAGAAELYDRVINTPATGEAAALSSAIEGLAHFRAMVALLGAGDEAGAREHLQALQERDATAPFTRLSAELWDQYGMTSDLRAACAAVRPQVRSQAGAMLATLQGAGLTVDPDTLCSVP